MMNSLLTPAKSMEAVSFTKRPVCGDFFHICPLYFHRYNYYRLQAAITRPLRRCEVSPCVSAAGNSISVPQRLSLHGKGLPTTCYVQCVRTRICGPLFSNFTPLHAGSSAPPTNNNICAYMFPRITRFPQLPLRAFAIRTVRTFTCIWQPFSAAHLSCLTYGVGVATITMSTESPACPRSIGGLKVFKNVLHTMKGMWMT